VFPLMEFLSVKEVSLFAKVQLCYFYKFKCVVLYRNCKYLNVHHEIFVLNTVYIFTMYI
jgi:hypothetical protein